MNSLLNRLAGRSWSNLTGCLIGMGAPTMAALGDAAKAQTYDPIACALEGGGACDEAVLPSGLSLALAGFGALMLLLVVGAMILKRSRRRDEAIGER